MLTGAYIYPLDLQCRQCSLSDIRNFAIEAQEIGIQYIGLCCGNSSLFLRELADVYGRTTPVSQFAPDVNKNAYMSSSVSGHQLKVQRGEV